MSFDKNRLKENLEEKSKKLIKDKLIFGILNTVYEICINYTKKEYLNDMQEYKEDMSKYFQKIQEVIKKGKVKRTDYISSLEERIRKMGKDTIPFFATLYFCDLLQDVILDYIELKEIHSESRYNENLKALCDIVCEFIDSISEPELYGTMLSYLPYSMTDEDYYNYISESFKLIKKGAQGEILGTMKGLKFTVCSFNEISDEHTKKELKNIANIDFENKSLKELENILAEVQNISNEYSQMIGDISAIYGALMGMIAIYKYCNSLEELFEDNFIFKDIFYSTKEMIEEDTFELMCETISYKCYDEIERVSEKIFNAEVELKDEIKENISFADLPNSLQLSISLDKYYTDLDIEENIRKIILKREENYKNADYEFIKFISEDFINYINSFEFSKDLIKMLKKLSFKSIACPLNTDSLKKLFINELSNLKDDVGGLVSGKLFQIIFPEGFEELISTI